MNNPFLRILAGIAVSTSLVVGCTREQVSTGASTSDQPGIAATGSETTIGVVAASLAPPPTTSPAVDIVAAGDPAAQEPDDEQQSFCAAWWRWDRSITIVLATWLNATGVSEPAAVAGATTAPASPGAGADPSLATSRAGSGAIEAAAATTMVTAFYEIGVWWPDDIESLRDPAFDAFGGVFDRARRATELLGSEGTNTAQSNEIANWWNEVLGSFDGSDLPTLDQAPAALRNTLWDAGGVVAAANQTPYVELVPASDPAVAELYNYTERACAGSAVPTAAGSTGAG